MEKVALVSEVSIGLGTPLRYFMSSLDNDLGGNLKEGVVTPLLVSVVVEVL